MTDNKIVERRLIKTEHIDKDLTTYMQSEYIFVTYYSNGNIVIEPYEGNPLDFFRDRFTIIK